MSNPDEVCVCPYNKAHSIVLSRMQFHLSKCRIQHPNGEKVKCPFNTTHIIDKRELDLHVKWCQERIALDKLVYQVGSGSSFVQIPSVDLTELQSPAVSSSGEVWDDEEASAPCSILDAVKEISQQKPTLRNKICASESVRKAHRKNERLRFIEMNNARADAEQRKPGQPNPSGSNYTKKTLEYETKRVTKTSDLKTDKAVVSDKSSESETEQTVISPQSPPSPRSSVSNIPQIPPSSASEERKVQESNESWKGARPRDPRNPWGPTKPAAQSSFGDIIKKDKVESRNLQQAAREESRSYPSERAPVAAWGRRPPATLTTSSDIEVTASVQQMSIGERRDRGNPWKMKNIAANFQTPENEFPTLSDSKQSGRDKRF